MAVYHELAENRLRELLEDIEAHKEEFREKIIESPEFKATFINVWEMHIRENNAEKRKRLRHFLLNLGKGEDIPDDLHTKIYSVIEQMTEREAAAFGIIFENANRAQFRHMNLSTNGLAGFNDWPDDQKQDSVHSLYSYRLIDMVDGTIGSDMAIRQITPFGEKFYDFVIKEPGQPEEPSR